MPIRLRNGFERCAECGGRQAPCPRARAAARAARARRAPGRVRRDPTRRRRLLRRARNLVSHDRARRTSRFAPVRLLPVRCVGRRRSPCGCLRGRARPGHRPHAPTRIRSRPRCSNDPPVLPSTTNGLNQDHRAMAGAIRQGRYRSRAPHGPARSTASSRSARAGRSSHAAMSQAHND